MVKLDPAPADVSKARCAMTDSAKRWALPVSLSEDARLIVSELVTNAIVHGRGQVTLRLLYRAGLLRIEVIDESLRSPQMRTASADDVHGRGLILVDALAHGWGVSNEGRTTWATLRTSEGNP
ncbi:ATP-binding protein [Streptomyces sp. CB04723]|uniref:ATP-binding protein n=1 Tax=Streptomyces TaxID=1883 RepID=UPI0015C4C1F6|nr:ATP-binding protein [Streptomyces sp. CB04723]QLG31235.1 ATP-binding protein [Streptomyces sp. CB04723]